MPKKCDVCGKKVPDDFQNNLCLECYDNEVAENARLVEQEEKGKQLKQPPKVGDDGLVATTEFSKISDPNYKERPEKEDKPQWMANVIQFEKTGHFLWKDTRWMYQYLLDHLNERTLNHPQAPPRGKHIWKPNVVDVGCGSGAGANLMSQEANFVWGIDKNVKSVEFANELFKREKNNIYYTPQVEFAVIDIVKDEHKYQQFDVVVAIEIIEHIYDYATFLTNIIKHFKKNGTEWFISTPNRNNKNIRDDHPQNMYHVREWTSEEFHAVLSDYFKNIEFMTTKGVPIEGKTTEHTPLLARCTGPKI